ncbi:SCO family protein [Flavihumibacter sp. R14]|nr:SCO family protein [Flavihumibacter soli]
MNPFPLKKILILVTMLAVPGLLYYLLQEKGKNRYRPLSIYGPKEVSKTFHTKRGKKIADTVYHTVRPFKLINQDQEPVVFPADSHQITVVNFFFSRCPSFCSDMNKEVERVSSRFSKNRLLQFFSITVDPEHDNSSILKSYSAQFKNRPAKWNFLTGDKSEIYKLAHESFLVDALKDTTTTSNFIHSPMLILLDPQQRIRGYYDSANKEEVDKLTDEIKVLITEELRGVKDR